MTEGEIVGVSKRRKFDSLQPAFFHGFASPNPCVHKELFVGTPASGVLSILHHDDSLILRQAMRSGTYACKHTFLCGIDYGTREFVVQMHCKKMNGGEVV